MGSELIINATLPETRIALLEDGEIQELYIERDHSRGIVGNIYKGRIIRVLPGMQAAFVDIGLDKAAFLYVDDVYFPDMESAIEVSGDNGKNANAQAASQTVAPLPAPLAEPIAEGDVSAESGAPEVSVPVAEIPDAGEWEDEASESVDNEDDEEDGEILSVAQRRKNGENINIQDLVKEGQEILVQVAKDPIGTKGARLTCHISLPGRYLVFMPTVDHVGVSRRIENDGERRRLKENILKYRPAKTGFIVRTASSTQDGNKIKADIEYLVKTWNDVRDKFRKSKPPTLVYQDYTLVIRAIRDMMTEEVDKLIVDSRQEHKQIMRFVQRFMPNVKGKIELYERPTPIFDYYGIELELARALDRKVWLKSGGYLVIDQSEALVAIDVNTGRFVGKRNLEDTILKTNLEAVKEIAYQLRLRNCGGIIILDLIDMEKESNREKVYQALEEALKKDRARPTILKISQLGLVEMTRKRTRDNVVRTLCEPCPYCEGRGFIKNKLTIAYEILREMEREGFNRDTSSIIVECNPAVAQVLGGDRGALIDDIQRNFGKEVVVKSNPQFHLEQFDVAAQRGDRRVGVKEAKKDAKGLGEVVSISDTAEDQVSRRGEFGIGPESIEQAVRSLPFVDDDKMTVDGDRELREERGGDRQRRGRRGNPVRPSKKGRDKDRERKVSQAEENNDEADLDRRPVQTDAPQDDSVSQNREVVVDFEEIESEEISVAQQVVQTGPRNYDEYIKTAPEPGTELTRAEWESQNQNRVRAHHSGHKQGGSHGGKDSHNQRRHHRHRRSRRGRGGGGRGQNARHNPRPHA